MLANARALVNINNAWPCRNTTGDYSKGAEMRTLTARAVMLRYLQSGTVQQKEKKMTKIVLSSAQKQEEIELAFQAYPGIALDAAKLARAVARYLGRPATEADWLTPNRFATLKAKLPVVEFDGVTLELVKSGSGPLVFQASKAQSRAPLSVRV